MAMNMKHILAATSAALLIGAACVPAQALSLNVGGISVGGGSGGNGGTHVSVGAGNTGVNATIGGGSNVATVGAGGASVGVGTTTGNLITSNGGTTNVNLGGVGGGVGNTISNTLNGVANPVGTTLDGVNPDLPGLPGLGGVGNALGGGLNATEVASAYGELSGADQQLLKVRCKAVLMNPVTFDAGMIKLCRILGQLGR
jgi:hypothetical protein